MKTAITPVMDFAAIYSITNRETGKLFVGSAINLRKRWNSHLQGLRTGTHCNSQLQRSWSEHGEAAFELTVLERIFDASSRIDREQHWIDKLQAANQSYGFNKLSAQTKANIGTSNRGRKHDGEALERKQAAARHPDFIAKLQNKSASEELRCRISRAKGGLGATLTADETKDAIAAYERGEFRIKDLAANHGVSYTTMQGLLSGRGGKQIRARAATLPRAMVNTRISKTLQKVPDKKVAEINALYASGVRQFEIAKRFGLNRAMVCRIVNKSLKCYAEAASA